MSPEHPLSEILGPILVTVGICIGYTVLLFRYLRQAAKAAEKRQAVLAPSPQPIEKADFLIAASIAVSFYLLCLWRLGQPTEMVFDEVHHVRAAAEYHYGLDPHEWTHPPLAKLMMSASMKAWGSTFDPRDEVWKPDAKFTERQTIGWRFPSVVFGAFSLLALYALTRSLFGNRLIAINATMLLGLDGLFFVQSRIAMTNIYTVCFILTGTLGTWLYIKHGKRRFLLLTGLALGLALSTRWTSLWAWGLNGVLLLWYLFAHERHRWKDGKGSWPIAFLKWAAVVLGAMVVIPLGLYAISYIPNVLQAEGTLSSKLWTMGENGPIDWSHAFSTEARAYGRGWFKVINLQGDMWRYHSLIKESHPYSSPWWSWPLLLRPVWYYFQSPDGQVSGIWGMGNAFIWWAFVGSLLATSVLAKREKNPALGLISLLGFGMWLAWAIKPRPLIFAHYLFESIPFACIALAYLWWRLSQPESETVAGEKEPVSAPKQFAQIHLYLIAGWFIFYYPTLSALPIPDWYFRLHVWFKDIWI